MPRIHMPQMDGLRAVAVAPVLYQHWYNPKLIDAGYWGVILFFVLSGYLITGSLFQLKDRRLSVPETARLFFSRRARRLFPAFYLVLAVALAVVPTIRPNWIWYAGYGSNVLQQSLGNHYTALTPTWSLAVEEQFYLIWFFVVLWLPPKWIGLVLAPLVILAATILRGFVIGGADALAMGSLLCIVERDGWTAIPKGLGLVAAGCLIAAGFLSWIFGPITLVATLIGLAASYAVWRARRNECASWWDQLLQHPCVRYIGKISYGIYLYQMLALIAVSQVPGIWRAGFPGFVCLAVGLAAISYHLMERPILSGERPLSGLAKMIGDRIANVRQSPAQSSDH